MKPVERIGAIVLIGAALILFFIRMYFYYIDHTKLVPAVGGQMIDAIYGDVKYINPILVQSDAEKSVSKLVFSGLVKFDGDNVIPDLAEKWDISPDGKKYTFYLRKNATFHDDEPVTARDIAFTIDSIKAPELKSPLLPSWADVTATVVDDYTITFDLPKSYGPFIYNCSFGVLPSHLPSDEFSKKFIGSGPYKYVKANKKGSQIQSVELKRFANFYLTPSIIDKIKLAFYSDQDQAKKAFDNKKADLLSGIDTKTAKNLSFRTSKRLELILNITDTQLKDKDFRQKLLTGQKFADKVTLRLVSPDTQYQRDQAEALKRKYADQNIELTLDFYNSLKMQDILAARNYQLLLYGFDFGYDRDPYIYWHTTQINKLNFSGWSDKKTDILLEDARLITDLTARNQKYDEFFAIINNEYLYQDFEPVQYNFSINDKIKNVSAITGNESNSRYNDVADWFINEKRVGKGK